MESGTALFLQFMTKQQLEKKNLHCWLTVWQERALKNHATLCAIPLTAISCALGIYFLIKSSNCPCNIHLQVQLLIHTYGPSWTSQ